MVHHKRIHRIFLCLAALAFSIAGCNLPSIRAEGTPTGLPAQTSTSAPSAQLTSASPTATPATQQVMIYLVAIEDNGVSGAKIGCGDSLAPVMVQIVPTKAVLQAALTALLGLHEQYYGGSGLYNALYQSDLEVEKITLADGKETVELSGELRLGGVCDGPRVQGQLEATAKQFTTVSEVLFILNGKPLEQVLSNR